MDEERYLRGIYKLHEKCQQIQRENERFVARLHYIKKLTKRRQKDVNLLKDRLDLYNDNWRTAQPNNTKSRRSVPKKLPKMNKQQQVQTAAATTNPNGNAAPPMAKRAKNSENVPRSQHL